MTTEAIDYKTQEEREAALKHDLLRGGRMKELVAEQRIPMFVDAKTSHIDYSIHLGWDRHRGTTYGRVSEDVVMCHIPPEGTQAGDSYKFVEGFGMFEFISPTGESRGYTQTIPLTPRQATSLEKKLATALKSAVVPNAPIVNPVQ